jgi:hypothetical protein
LVGSVLHIIDGLTVNRVTCVYVIVIAGITSAPEIKIPSIARHGVASQGVVAGIVEVDSIPPIPVNSIACQGVVAGIVDADSI